MVGPSLEALPRVGDRVDRYEICGEVDTGGMSVVYAVKRVGGVGGWSKLLAMKVILPNLARQERFARMFMDEARILSLIQHPNVVQVNDVGETDSGLLFMVMELLRGRSLARLIREALRTDGLLDRSVLLGILADGAEGLNAAHETHLPEGEPARIVHRDVSPQNIHIGFDGVVKVVDFGIAAAQGRLTETRTGELKGKLSYIAPEQILRRPTDRRADIWSLGVIAWELLAGRRLFTGENEIETLRNVDSMEVPHISTFVRTLPTRVADVIMRCLARDRDERPPTASVVATAFREGARALAIHPDDTMDGLQDRRSYVQRLLGTDMVIENERLAAAVRQGPPPPMRRTNPERDEEEISDPFRVEVSHVEETHLRAPGRARRPWAAIAAGVVAILAAFGTWAITRSVDDDAVMAEPAPPRARAQPAPARPAAAATPAAVDPALLAPPPTAPAASSSRTVELVLDSRVRRVWVDGTLVTDRPVVVPLAGADHVIEAQGVRGERSRSVVGVDSPDQVPVSVPRVGGNAVVVKKGGSPLLGSPYRRKNR